MNKNIKALECKNCQGVGKIKTLVKNERVEDKLIAIYKNCDCEVCKGKGKILVDDLTYYLAYNEIKNELHKLYNDKDYDTTVTKECDCCKGLGYINKTETTKDDIIIETKDICISCKGTGELVDEEETKKHIQEKIKAREEKLDKFKEMQKIDKENLILAKVKRTPSQIIKDKNLNICFNCQHCSFDPWLSNSKNPICEKCCHHDVTASSESYFLGLGKRSEMWYNKHIHVNRK